MIGHFLDWVFHSRPRGDSDYDSWNNFFEYLTSAAAAILAIIFAALTFSATYWRKTGLRTMAVMVALTELAIPLFFGLMYLQTGHPWRGAGRWVGWFGYGVIALHVGVAVWHRCVKGRKFERTDVFQIFVGVPIVFFTFSLMLWRQSLTWKAGTCLWLIFSGLTEAGYTLIQRDDAEREPLPAPVADTTRLAAQPAIAPDKGLFAVEGERVAVS